MSGIALLSLTPHRALKLVSTFALLVASIVGCRGDRVVTPEDGNVSLQPELPSEARVDSINGLGAPQPVEFATYENSHQVVHPSAVAFPSDWHGRRFWLALTPYPNSDSRVENPSLFASESGDNFATPSGLTNPLEQTRRGYLSDPDLVYDPASDQLRLYYREVIETRTRHRRAKHEGDIVNLTESSDGNHWSAAREVARDAGRFVVSPAVARRSDGDWSMWAVDAGHTGCNARETHVVVRRSTDGVTWTAPKRAALTPPGFLPWHLDVQWVPQLDAYWALIAAFPRGHSCIATSLFLATSSDGVRWTTYPSPVLARGALPAFATNVYRSTFVVAPDGQGLTIWLSGARTVERRAKRKPAVLRWSAAVWHTRVSALLTHVRMNASVTGAVVDSESPLLRRLAAENALP